MEKRQHRCKLCSRSFGNGRALGGHMRSHMSKSFNQEFDFSDDVDIEQRVKATAEDDDDDDDDDDSYAESETERMVSRRSKRVPRKFIHYPSKRANTSHDNNSSSLTSISDTTPEEHVARSLIMLSQDNWELEFEGDSKSNHKLKLKLKLKLATRGSSTSNKYRCGECNKLFKSYQALGGHRASHNKIRPPPPSGSKPPEKVHNCPFCHKVFPSGQALGGHKRSHFIGATGSAPASTSPGAVAQNSTKCQALSIDLNLPAPVDDEEIISQVEVSDVC